jgi:hypothetical protein
MSTLVPVLSSPPVPAPAEVLPLPVPWRDPHTVSRDELRAMIRGLEQACAANPHSPDLHTCLGMACAMDFQVYRSMDLLEAARTMAPDHFWAQFKFAELQYRLRALPLAEQETLRALALARTPLEYTAARAQLQEIRRLFRNGTQKPAWTKPLFAPALLLLAGLALLVFTCLR